MVKHSPQQEKVFESILNTQDNIVVEAGPGSGKTTTIVDASKLIPRHKKSLFLAFNKSIVGELREKLPQHIEVSTVHSLGMRSIMGHFRTRLKVNQFKTLNFTEKYVKEANIKEKEKMGYKFNVLNIIDMLKMNMLDNNQDSIESICTHYGIDCLSGEKTVSEMVYNDLIEYNSFLDQESDIDFTDMIFLPVKLNMKLSQYDVVFIDEAQDLNQAQKQFIDKLIAPGGRKIIVGDPKQAIYSFAGADSKGFFEYQERPNTTTLPLSVSFRCPKSVVLEAQKIYPNIDFNETAIDGVVRAGNIDEALDGDMIVCRNTKPLIKAYFQLLGQHKKSYILGKDIEKGLLALISKVSDLSKEQGFDKLYEILLKTGEELSLKGVTNIVEHKKYASLKEKIEVLKIVGEGYNSFNEIENKVKQIFDSSKDGIMLCTGHKSKGLEADRVFYIQKFEGVKLIPSKYAKSAWEKEQERNLLFVIITRAKKELIYVNLL